MLGGLGAGATIAMAVRNASFHDTCGQLVITVPVAVVSLALSAPGIVLLATWGARTELRSLRDLCDCPSAFVCGRAGLRTMPRAPDCVDPAVA